MKNQGWTSPLPAIPEAWQFKHCDSFLSYFFDIYPKCHTTATFGGHSDGYCDNLTSLALVEQTFNFQGWMMTTLDAPYITPEEIMTAAKSVVGNNANWRTGLAEQLGVDVGDINQWIESWDIAPPPAWLREGLATMLKDHAKRCESYAEYLLSVQKQTA